MIDLSDIEHLSAAKELKAELEKRAASEGSFACSLAADSLGDHINECSPEGEETSGKVREQFEESLKALAEDINSYYPGLAHILIGMAEKDEKEHRGSDS